MKTIYIIILGLSIFSCQAQHLNHEIAIHTFIASLKSGKETLKSIKEENILHISQEESNLEAQKEYDSTFSIILKSLHQRLLDCDKEDNGLEVLSLNESKKEKGLDEELVVPERGSVYILYCGDTIITRFLIIDEKIASFSVINKSGRRVFLLL